MLILVELIGAAEVKRLVERYNVTDVKIRVVLCSEDVIEERFFKNRKLRILPSKFLILSSLVHIIFYIPRRRNLKLMTNIKRRY